jgi:hypothetical protein
MEQINNHQELAANHKPKPWVAPQTLNISQLAALTGYTTKTIRDRLQKASCQSVGMDHNGGVLYEVKAALKAIYALESFKNKESKEDLKRYLQELKAQELEFKLQQQRNKLVPVSEIEPTIRQLFLFIKQTIDSFPSLVVHSLKSELPPELLPKVNSIMEEQTKKINEELSKPLFQVETKNDDE